MLLQLRQFISSALNTSAARWFCLPNLVGIASSPDRWRTTTLSRFLILSAILASLFWGQHFGQVADAAINDLNGDGNSDILIRSAGLDNNGTVSAFLMSGTTVLSSANIINNEANWNITHTADFNGDGKADILWRKNDGSVTMWLMNGTSNISALGLIGPTADWRVAHIGDFNGDGKADILWSNTNGAVTLWLMNGGTVTSAVGILGADPDWRVSHVADFNGDGKADLLWQKRDGSVTIWLMNGATVTSAVGILGTDPNWRVSHTGDFNGDSKADLLWQKRDGSVTMWLMNGTAVTSAAGLLGTSQNWFVSHVADFSGDGKADILWRQIPTGSVTMWLMNGGVLSSAVGIYDGKGEIPVAIDDPLDPLNFSNWRVMQTPDFNGDGKADLLWKKFDGSNTIWLMSGTSVTAKAGLVTTVTTPPPTYTIGGSVSGLTSGAQLILQNNGADQLTLNANGPFTFTTRVVNNGNYAVTVGTQPTGQSCSVANGTGTKVAANVTNVSIVCTTITTMPSFTFKEFTSPDRANIACSTVTNATALIGKIHLAQTHLLETTHPFFHLSAERATLIRVSVQGAGAAPAIAVRGSLNGNDLGRFCLTGPATLPATVDESMPNPATSYTGTIPAAWLKAGLQLTVDTGSANKTITSSELKIGASPELTLITADFLLFGDTEPNPVPATFNAEFAAKLPLTKVRYGGFPIKLAIKDLPIEPRDDGLSGNGAQVKQPALLANASPRCSSADRTAGTCAPWSGFSVLSAVRNLAGRLQVANGMEGFAHWYGALSKNRKVGGGLGGGSVASGDDYSFTFNHEAGHTFDMPHWGGSLYSRVAANADQAHPYTGSYLDAGQAVGGGFGNSWAYDGLDGSFLNPICAASGKERQEPMQRYGDADCNQPNRAFDHFGDYSALFIHRYFAGASGAYAGTVSSPRDITSNTMPRFSYPSKNGRPNLILGAQGTTPKIVKWNPATQSYAEVTPASVSSDPRIFGERYPLKWDVPVYTLWGSYSNTTPAATTILDPLKYKGNMKRVWDPTNADDFASMKTFVSGDAFYWGADLVVKAEYDNGTVQHALAKNNIRGTDPLNGSSFGLWAVNVPAPDGAKLTRVSLYYRPMEVRNPESGNAINLNSDLNSTLTAARYMDSARLVSTRNF
jgi:Peptidase M66/FG-GAP-like repeat